MIEYFETDRNVKITTFRAGASNALGTMVNKSESIADETIARAQAGADNRNEYTFTGYTPGNLGRNGRPALIMSTLHAYIKGLAEFASPVDSGQFYWESGDVRIWLQDTYLGSTSVPASDLMFSLRDDSPANQRDDLVVLGRSFLTGSLPKDHQTEDHIRKFIGNMNAFRLMSIRHTPPLRASAIRGAARFYRAGEQEADSVVDHPCYKITEFKVPEIREAERTQNGN